MLLTQDILGRADREEIEATIDEDIKAQATDDYITLDFRNTPFELIPTSIHRVMMRSRGHCNDIPLNTLLTLIKAHLEDVPSTISLDIVGAGELSKKELGQYYVGVNNLNNKYGIGNSAIHKGILIALAAGADVGLNVQQSSAGFSFTDESGEIITIERDEIINAIFQKKDINSGNAVPRRVSRTFAYQTADALEEMRLLTPLARQFGYVLDDGFSNWCFTAADRCEGCPEEVRIKLIESLESKVTPEGKRR